MTRPMHPADVLELSLAGVLHDHAAEDLVAAIAALRSASSAIRAPRGLRARRGSILALTTPQVPVRQPAAVSRRLQAALMAATFALVGSISFVGASTGISWLRDLFPDGPSRQAAPVVDAEATATASPSPTVTPSPDLEPSDLNVLDQAPRRMPSDDETDEDDESPEDDEEDVYETGGDADDAEDASED